VFRLTRVLFAVASPLGLAAIACGRDVVVGADAPDSGTGSDASGMDVGAGDDASRSTDGSSDSGADDSAGNDGGDATSGIDAGDGGGTDGEAGAVENGALSVGKALTSGGWLVAGYQGGSTGTEPTSDAWLAHVGANGAVTSQATVDLFGGADRADFVAPLRSGGYALAGGSIDAGRMRAFLRRSSDQDVMAWTTMLDSAQGGDSEALAVVEDADGTLVVGGNETSTMVPLDGWIARVASTGGVTFRTSVHFVSGGVAANTRVRAITLAGLPEDIFTGGERTVAIDGGITQVPTLLAFKGSDGSLSNSDDHVFSPDKSGSVLGIYPMPSSMLFVCATLRGPGDPGSVGVALVSQFFGGPTTNVYLYSGADPLTLGGCVPTSDNAVLLVGTAHTASGDKPWAAKHDLGTFMPAWTRVLPAPAAPRLLAVAADSLGGGFAVGTTPPPSAHTWTPIAP